MRWVPVAVACTGGSDWEAASLWGLSSWCLQGMAPPASLLPAHCHPPLWPGRVAATQQTIATATIPRMAAARQFLWPLAVQSRYRASQPNS